jgi:5-methylcytosine-specific restriction endonuclease McrA
MDTQSLVGWITQLIAEDKLVKFYQSKEWTTLRTKILQEHHYECLHCRQHGIITKAQTVHHVNHVKDRPDLALTQHIMDDDGNRIDNLIPLCNQCHNKEHPEKLLKYRTRTKKDITDERWD